MVQVVFIDLVLAGDNAIVVGMVAAGVAPEQRRKVICGGIVLAVVLRILFAALTMQLQHVDGSQDAVPLKHTLNEAQIGWFKAGSALNVIAAAQ